jgi:hypothetical protein
MGNAIVENIIQGKFFGNAIVNNILRKAPRIAPSHMNNNSTLTNLANNISPFVYKKYLPILYTLDDNFVIKTSTVPNAGLGLFAKKTLPPKSLIGVYVGEPISKRTADNRCSRSLPGKDNVEYVMRLNQKPAWMKSSTWKEFHYTIQKKEYLYIDGERLGNYTRYIAHSNNRSIINAKIEPDGIIYASKQIAPGAEIFMSYGKSHRVCEFERKPSPTQQSNNSKSNNFKLFSNHLSKF